MKVWMVATYKKTEIKRLQENLKNQDLDYFNPVIKTTKHNLAPKDEPLFPGYIFIHANPEHYHKIRYTKGINKVIRFDHNIAILTEDEINELKRIEDDSFSSPIIQQVFVGQEGVMSEGAFKGSLVRIASLPKKDRVNIFVHILGKMRRISASLSEIKL
tara:strand:+ start:64 stop:540 length:477 start_codon:yes stop_codon:yes gene_type:complete